MKLKICIVFMLVSMNLLCQQNNQGSAIENPDWQTINTQDDPVQMAKTIIDNTPMFYNGVVYNIILVTINVGFTAVQFGGAYILLESPKLVVDLVTGGFYKVGATIAQDFIVDIIATSVKTPQKVCKKISKTMMIEGRDDYKIAYRIGSRYHNSGSLTRAEAIEFLQHYWGVYKIANANKLQARARNENYSVSNQVAEITIEELFELFGDKYQSFLGIDNKLPLTQTAFFINDMFEVLEQSKIGLMDYPPYLDFIANIELINQSRLEMLNKFSGGTTSPNTQISLGFIIDSSGSMSSNDPQDMRKEALEMIINDRLDGSENVFIVDFDESAKLMNSTTSGWSKSHLINAVRGIDSRGGTNIRSGLDKMKASMQNKGLDYSNTAVILLSDGMDNSNYKKGTQWFSHNNIPVYTISFRGQSNETIMTEIAQLTGGNFMKARNAQEIFNIFNIFYNELSGSSMLFQIISNILQGQSIFHQFFNDSTSPVYVPLIWGGSKISLTLTSPDGKTYSQGGGSAKWNVGDNYVTATIQKPAIGLWKATLHGVQIPSGGEPYSFEVHNKSDLEFDISSSTQGLVNIDLVPNKANLIQSQTTNVKVLTPKGNSMDISSAVQNNRISFIPNSGKGNYKFDIDIKGARTNGTQFQRHLVKYVFIGENVNPYVAPIHDVMGNYVYAKVGSIVGAYQGLKCYVYRGDPNRIADRIAEGHITYCEKDKCTVQISRYDTMLKTGDILKLDIKQLIGD